LAVIHTIGHDLAEFGVDKVMHLHLLGAAFPPIVTAGVLVGTDCSFFFVSIEMTGLPTDCMRC
jgi:hypothetical protein